KSCASGLRNARVDNGDAADQAQERLSQLLEEARRAGFDPLISQSISCWHITNDEPRAASLSSGPWL
ncbi:MAG TPA: hypothetical protein VE860_13795, partial [Chthoniobacterales bacterium]|nr:hypothetical protein [Chthoniobacterales bacterium]